jgi:hypothetical protein
MPGAVATAASDRKVIPPQPPPVSLRAQCVEQVVLKSSGRLVRVAISKFDQERRMYWSTLGLWETREGVTAEFCNMLAPSRAEHASQLTPAPGWVLQLREHGLYHRGVMRG